MIYIISGQMTPRTEFIFKLKNSLEESNRVFHTLFENDECHFELSYYSSTPSYFNYLLQGKDNIDKQYTENEQAELKLKRNLLISLIKKHNTNIDLIVPLNIMGETAQELMKEFKDITIINLIRDVNTMPYIEELQLNETINNKPENYNKIVGKMWCMYDLSLVPKVITIDFMDFMKKSYKLNDITLIKDDNQIQNGQNFTNNEIDNKLNGIQLKKVLKGINLKAHQDFEKYHKEFEFTNLIAKRFGYQEIK